MLSDAGVDDLDVADGMTAFVAVIEPKAIDTALDQGLDQRFSTKVLSGVQTDAEQRFECYVHGHRALFVGRPLQHFGDEGVHIYERLE